MYNLKETLANKKCLRFIEVHNYLSYSAIRAATVKNKNSELITYDGMWSSSLTDSTAVGLPDTEIFPLSVRIRQAQNILYYIRFTNDYGCRYGRTSGAFCY